MQWSRMKVTTSAEERCAKDSTVISHEYLSRHIVNICKRNRLQIAVDIECLGSLCKQIFLRVIRIFFWYIGMYKIADLIVLPP